MTDKKMADPKASQEQNNSRADVNTTPTDDTLFLDLRKSDSERLQIRVREYRGRFQIDLRAWYRSDDGVLHPSSKGITLRPEQVPEIVRGLTLAGMAFDPRENT